MRLTEKHLLFAVATGLALAAATLGQAASLKCNILQMQPIKETLSGTDRNLLDLTNTFYGTAGNSDTTQTCTNPVKWQLVDKGCVDSVVNSSFSGADETLMSANAYIDNSLQLAFTRAG